MARNNKLKNAYFKLLYKKIRKQKLRCSRLTYRSMQRSQKRQQEIEKASAFITNISNCALTDQIIALSKGLGFIPTPADKPCKISLICDTHNLKRTMRIRHHAAEKPKSTAIPLVFKTKYNPHFAGKYTGQALLKHWNIIEKNVRLFPKPPMIAYSRSENLRDSLVKAKLHTREKNDYTYLVRNEEDPPSSPTLHTLQDLDLGSTGFNMFIDFVEIEEGQNTQGPTPSNRRQGHSSHPFRVHTHGKTYQTNMDGNLCPKTL